MTRAWLVPIGGAIAAPLVTWLPMLAAHYPGTGLPVYQPAVGIDIWSTYTFWGAAMILVAALLYDGDRWLAAALGLAALALVWRGAYLDPTHSILFAFGALGLWAMRRAPAARVARVRTILAALGVAQALYMLQQSYLKYDFLWMIWGGERVPVVQALGTLGTVDAASAYVAITAPLMPLWALPFAVAAVLSGHSIGATLALTLGLLIRYSSGWRASPWRCLIVCGPVVLLLARLVYVKGTATATVSGRLALWKFGLSHAGVSDPVLGWGLGGWAQRVPALQGQQSYLPTGEIFREAHSEYVQWACELGVVGLVVLAGWLWTHRAMFVHPVYGGSLVALGANSLAFFPLHVVSLALLGVILVGLATPTLHHAEA